MLKRWQYLLTFAPILVGLLLASLGNAQGPPDTNYDEEKVGAYTLPDPLVFNDGSSVRTAADWTNRRRAEVLELFATNVFGHSPAPPRQLNYEVFDTDLNALGGKAIRKQITIYFSPAKDGPKEDILLYLPKAARKPVPIFLILSFSGNQTATNETAIKLGTAWNLQTRQKSQAPEDSRGRGQADTERILARGYGYATVNYVDIEPDFRGGHLSGLRRLSFKPGQTEAAPGEWGAIGAWAYGLSRALDYFEKDKDVDAKRVAIVGHSRLGKTVLWAGSIDTRFAMVISSCSGEGGASLSRRNYGERVKDLVNPARYPYWFTADYQKFADAVEKLPVDMHELIALIAPRPVYITAGETDRWADPKGEFLACVAAGPVFRLLGGEDLGTDQMPALDQPIMKSLAYHIHTGGHSITPFDWEQFLKYADMKLK
jgi:(4-O-methyl)-D-glucuronate---lignin esterase